MATKRGFVQKIDIDRAGLVKVSVVHVDGSAGVYVIRDLDADPERFNERLSKLAILRDAMDRAEPVEIEHVAGEAGQEIRRAARITRDQLDPPGTISTVSGLVLDVMLHAQHGATSTEESFDIARIAVLGTDFTGHQLVLNMQIPERLVAQQQLEIIRDAHLHGRMARFLVTMYHGEGRILAVAAGGLDSALAEGEAESLDGFTESLSLIDDPSLGALASTLAHVRFTTAPAFTGAGNTVGLAPFTPVTVDLLVSRGSLAYDLFKAGLRDNLRMRVSVSLLADQEEEDKPGTVGKDPAGNPNERAAEHVEVLKRVVSRGRLTGVSTIDKARFGICWGAELLAPLASASRPVWITIARTSLDHGPDGFPCTDGVPSSDLQPSSLRDLRIPYPAVWEGIGCFNCGVYRLQFELPWPFKVKVDGEELCLHDSDKEGVKFAHACLCGEHEVRVEIAAWTCEDQFTFDVYRLR